MRGHSNWVKNIEYSAKDNYLGQAHDMFSRIFRIMNLRIFSTKYSKVSIIGPGHSRRREFEKKIVLVV